MSHILFLNLVFFAPTLAGAAAFTWTVLRILRAPTPPSEEGGGIGAPAGGRPRSPRAGPDDLARAA